jgi:hypothetical protein
LHSICPPKFVFPDKKKSGIPMPSIGFEPIFYGNSSTFYKHDRVGYLCKVVSGDIAVCVCAFDTPMRIP